MAVLCRIGARGLWRRRILLCRMGMKTWFVFLFLILPFGLASVSQAGVAHCHGSECGTTHNHDFAMVDDDDHDHDAHDHLGQTDDEHQAEESDDTGKTVKTDAHGWHSHAYGFTAPSSYEHALIEGRNVVAFARHEAGDSALFEPPLQPPSLA